MSKQYQCFLVTKAIYDHDFEKWFVSCEHATECLRHQDLPYDLAVNIFESEKEKQTIKEVEEELINNEYLLRYQLVVDNDNQTHLIKPIVIKKE